MIKVCSDIPFRTSYLPYTHAFVYPKEGTPFLLKGPCGDVKRLLEEIPSPCVVHFTYFKDGKSRNLIRFINLKRKGVHHYGLDQKCVHGKKRHAIKAIAKTGEMVVETRKDGCPYSFVKYFRRIPRSWIKELDQFC